MTTDIEAQLREYTSGDLIAADGFVGGDVLGTLREAADTIAALKAQLAEAREALKETMPYARSVMTAIAHSPEGTSWKEKAAAIYNRAAEVLRKMEKGGYR